MRKTDAPNSPKFWGTDIALRKCLSFGQNGLLGSLTEDNNFKKDSAVNYRNNKLEIY